MLRSRRNIGKRSRTGLKYKAHMDGLPNLRIYKRPVKVDSGFFNAIQFRIARGVQWRRNFANPPYGQGEKLGNVVALAYNIKLIWTVYQTFASISNRLSWIPVSSTPVSSEFHRACSGEKILPI